MKYVFFGTPRIARLVLEELIDTMSPIAVVTNPDRPAGRKQVLTPPPAKELVLEKKPDLELLQPEKLAAAAPRLREFQPDLFVLAAYGQIIPADILAIPRLGTIGVHPSLLPRHRGPSPMQATILAGDEMTGVTLYLMDEEVDHGPILAKEELPVRNMDYLELEAALASLAGKMLLKLLPDLAAGKVLPQAQDHSAATFTRKFDSDDGFIPPAELQDAMSGNEDAPVSAERKIRALNPAPGVWTYGEFDGKTFTPAEDGRRTKLLAAEIQDKALRLRHIQPDGKPPRELS